MRNCCDGIQICEQRPWRVFILGDMGWGYGNEKRVCTPFDVIFAFLVSALIVSKFVGEYELKEIEAELLQLT